MSNVLSLFDKVEKEQNNASREQAIRDRNITSAHHGDKMFSLFDKVAGDMEVESRRQQRAYAEQAPPEVTAPVKEMLGNLGNRRYVLKVLRKMTPEQREEALRLAPGLAQEMGDDRGGIVYRTLGAIARGITHGVSQPIMELAGTGGTREEIDYIRQLDAAASQEYTPTRPGDPWYERGPLQAVEMTPWMATTVGAGGLGKTVATKAAGMLASRGAAGGKVAGMVSKAGQAVGNVPKIIRAPALTAAKAGELAGITAASFPAQYAQEVDQLKELGMEDSWQRRLLASGTALVGGAIEGIVPNPFAGSVSLKQGAMKAAREYVWEAIKQAPVELSEEFFQGVTSGLGEHIAQYIANEKELDFGDGEIVKSGVEKKTIADAFSKGWEQTKEAALPMAFLLGTPAAVGATTVAYRAGRGGRRGTSTSTDPFLPQLPPGADTSEDLSNVQAKRELLERVVEEVNAGQRETFPRELAKNLGLIGPNEKSTSDSRLQRAEAEIARLRELENNFLSPSAQESTAQPPAEQTPTVTPPPPSNDAFEQPTAPGTPPQQRSTPAVREKRTRTDYQINTEDAGAMNTAVFRIEDGSVWIMADGFDPIEYNSAFAKDKSDEELLAFAFEPLGFLGVNLNEPPQQPPVDPSNEEALVNNQELARQTAVEMERMRSEAAQSAVPPSDQLQAPVAQPEAIPPSTNPFDATTAPQSPPAAETDPFNVPVRQAPSTAQVQQPQSPMLASDLIGSQKPTVDAQTDTTPVPAVRSPEDHAAVPMFGVYETPFRGERKFFVKEFENRGAGDAMFDSLDEANKHSAIVARRNEEKVAREQKAKADEELAVKKKRDHEASFGGFLSADPKTKARQLKVLDSSRTYRGKVVTVKELIEQKVADGAIVNSEGQLESPDGAYLGSDKLTKFGIDYARHLIGSKPSDAVSAESQSEEVSNAQGTKKGGGPNVEVQTEGGQRPSEGQVIPQGEQATDKAPSPVSSPTEQYNKLPEKSREKFEAAWEGNDPQAMKTLVHSGNKVLRAEFENRTGEKLPGTVKGTNEVVDRVYQGRVKRETITPATDKQVGRNAAGEQLYEREDGTRYRMRMDRPDQHEGYPDFGGDLSEAQSSQPKSSDDKSKPEDRSVPSYRDWRFVSKARNSGKIIPNRVGVKFTPSQMQSIVKWAKSQGYSVSKVTQTGINVSDQSGKRLDIAMAGAAGVKAEESKAASARREEKQRQADADRKSRADGRDSAAWIANTFGDVMNDYNRNALSDYVEGVTDKYEGQVAVTWREPLEKLGALSPEGKVDWEKIKQSYVASSAVSQTPPAQENLSEDKKPSDSENISVEEFADIFANPEQPAAKPRKSQGEKSPSKSGPAKSQEARKPKSVKKDRSKSIEEGLREAKEGADLILKGLRDLGNTGLAGVPINADIARGMGMLANGLIKAGRYKFAEFIDSAVEMIGAPAVRYLGPYLEAGWNKKAETDSRLDAAVNVSDYLDGKSKSTDGDYGTPENPNRIALGRHFYSKLKNGESYARITDARKEASELIGGQPSNASAVKDIDEAVEIGVVLAARDIAQSGDSDDFIYSKLIDLYERQPNLSNRTSTSMAEQAYSTPAPLAFAINRRAGVTPNDTVYDSSAGNGMLLIVGGTRYANELNADRAESLRGQGIDTTNEDATSFTLGKPIDALVINPPFGLVNDESGKPKSWVIDGVRTDKVDHAITLQSIKEIPKDGKVAIIVGAKGFEKSEPKTDSRRGAAYLAEKRFYDALYDNYNVTDHFTVHGDLYRRQGASFPVDVIIIDGKGKSQRPKPYNIVGGGIPEVFRTWEDLKDAKLRPVSSVSSTSTGRDEGTDSATMDSGNEATVEGDAEALSPRPAGARVGGTDGRKPDPERLGGVDGQSGTANETDAKATVDGETALSERRGRDSGRRYAGGSDRSDSRVGLKPDETAETDHQVSYSPGSGNQSVDTLIPRNHQAAVAKSLDAVAEIYGDIDKFVASELGYDMDEFRDVFSAEQVDALALAIARHKDGGAFIIGDQTGVGKGRAAAAMMVYANRNGMVPVFITEKPTLYADMVRDLIDIRQSTDESPFNVLMTNSLSGKDVIPLPDGRVLKQSSNAAKENLAKAVASVLSGNMLSVEAKPKKSVKKSTEQDPTVYNAVFTTYSQMQPVRQLAPERAVQLKRISGNSFFILDESHNAGGSGDGDQDQQGGRSGGQDATITRAEIVRDLISDAAGVYFSSATYAKRPQTMGLYARTGMTAATNGDPNALAEAIATGGVPLQQVVSEQLVESGMYLRRERSFDGVEFNPKTIDVDLANLDNVASIFSAINFFDNYAQEAIQELSDEITSSGGSIAETEATGQAGLESTSFASILHNLVDQMLLAVKADAVANETIESIKNGEAPVIYVDSTFEAALKRQVEEVGASQGEEIDFSYKDLVRRYLERSREYTTRTDADDPDSVVRIRLTDAQLGPAGVAAYERALAMIDSFKGNMPASPIDWIRKRVTDAGYSISEITGRQVILDYGDDEKVRLGKRPDDEEGAGGRTKTVSRFNNGELDAVLINQSGSTGISMHSSEKFANKKPRHMIIGQPARNIDTFMQSLGRVHRTGQVVLPRFTLLMTNAPAEIRPASVLMKKLSSLNANVTASAKGAVSFDAPDVINVIGDQVVAEYLADNLPLDQALGEIVQLRRDGTPKRNPGIAKKASGRMALRPVAEQKDFWDSVIASYDELIEELNRVGKNPLVASTIDLKAKTIESVTIFDGDEGSSNLFMHPASVETVTANKPGKPMTADEVVAAVSNFYGNPASQSAVDEWVASTREEVAAAYQEYVSMMTKDLSGEDLQHVLMTYQLTGSRQLENLMERIALFAPGNSVSVHERAADGSLLEVIPGYVTKVKRLKGGNPLSASKWVADIAIASPDRIAKAALSRTGEQDPDSAVGRGGTYLEFRSNNELLSDVGLREFEESDLSATEIRYIGVGNILAAYSQLGKAGGQITFFTDSNGEIRRGVLMPRSFRIDRWNEARPVVLDDVDQAHQFLSQGGQLITPDRVLALMMVRGELIARAPKAKSRSGKYTINSTILRAASPHEFGSIGSRMEMAVPDMERQKRVLSAIMSVASLQAVGTDKNLARRVKESTPSKSEQKLGDKLDDLNDTLMQTAPDAINREMLLQATELAIAAEKAGIDVYDRLVAFAVKKLGEQRTREIGAYLYHAGNAAGMKGVRPTRDVLGTPGVTREQAVKFAKAAFPMLTDEQIEAGISLQVATAFGRDEIGYAPFGSPVPGQSLYQSTPRWYLKSRNIVQDKMGQKATSDQVLGMLRKNGVNEEELYWSGLEELLGSKQSVTKDEVLAAIDNGINVAELRLPGKRELNVEFFAQGEPGSWGNYTASSLTDRKLREGKYNVVVGDSLSPSTLTVHSDGKVTEVFKGETVEYANRNEADKAIRSKITTWASKFQVKEFPRYEKFVIPGGDSYRELLLIIPRVATGEYRSDHWDDANIVAHIRFNERTDADGKKVLFIEEVQSDWHQEGRKKGYIPTATSLVNEYRRLGLKAERVDAKRWRIINQEGEKVIQVFADNESSAFRKYAETTIKLARDQAGKVPDAPFKKTWPMLAMKRAVQYAAENGFDRIAWTTGEQQADRYDLSKQVESIAVGRFEGTYWFRAVPLGERGTDRDIEKEGLSANELAESIGKDLAEKAIQDIGDKDGQRAYYDSDLKVGGEGMKAFYDRILPNETNKLIKKFGAKVGQATIKTPAVGMQGKRRVSEIDEGWAVEVFDEDLEEWSEEETFETKEDAQARINEYKNSEEGMLVSSFDITPAMRESALQHGQTLFQNQVQGDNVKGWTTFITATRAIIGATDKADVSTFIHEFFHPMRRFLLDRNISQDKRAGITDADIMALEKYAGVKDGDWEFSHIEDRVARRQAAVMAEEKAAKAWEQYWFEGKAPNSALESLFEKIARWMRGVYKSINEITGGNLPKEVRDLFDKIVQRGGGVPPGRTTGTAQTDNSRGEPLTSIKNAVAEEIAVRRQAIHIWDAATETSDEWLEDADRMLRSDPYIAQRIVREMIDEKPRNLSNTEVAILQIHYRHINNLFENASDRMFSAHDRGDIVEKARLRVEVDALGEILWDIEEAAKAAGREWGRAGVARQIVLRKDFSRAAMLRRARVANGGNPLNEEQTEAIEKLAKQVADLEGKLAKAEQEKTDLERQLRAEKDINEEKNRANGTPRKSESKNKAASKLQDFAKKFANIFGFKQSDPDTLQQTEDERMLEEAGPVVQAYVDAGVFSLGELLANIERDLGSDLPMQARVAFSAAWKNLKDQGDIPTPAIDASNSTSLTRLARRIQRALVEAGITDRDEVVDAVQESLREMDIELDKRGTMDALSGYGQFTPLPDDNISKTIRDINGQLQQIAKLQDMGYELIGDEWVKVRDGVAPSKTGGERRTPTDEERELIRQVNEAKRQGGYKITDPESQLRSAVDAAKRAAANRIYDLQKALREGKPIVGNKTSLAGQDADLDEMRKELAEWTEKYRDMFPKPEATMEQRIAATNRVLDAEIAAIRRQLLSGDVMPKGRKDPVSTPEIEAKRARLEALRAQRETLQLMLNPNMKNEQAAKAYMAALLKQIADYQERLAKNDFDPKPKKPLRILTKEELLLKNQLEDVKDQFFRKAADYRLANMSPGEKAWDYTKEWSHLSRALMTSFDLSAVFRQGGVASFSHPKLAAQVSRDMWDALWSDQAEFDIAERIRNHDLYQFAMTAKLAITEDEARITKQEEAFMGRLVRWGIGKEGSTINKWSKKALSPVRASGRAYTTFLNGMRFELFKLMVDSVGGMGQVTADEAKIIAQYVNVATGRADLGKFNQAAANMSVIFFAPRYVASRFQYFAMPFYILPSSKISGRVKKAIAMEYARYISSVSLFLGSVVVFGSILAGDDDDEAPKVELDPRSTDFLKIRIGETRIDPMAGFSQIATFTTQVLSGQRKKQDGEVRDLRGENHKWGDKDTWDVVSDFVRKKLAPVPGAFVNLITGENVIGEKQTPLSVGTGLFVPLAWGEVKEAMQARGIPAGTAISMLALLGMGGGTYGPKTQYANGTEEQRKKQLEKDIKEMDFDSPDPAYSEFLTEKQIEQVKTRREERKQDLAYAASASPNRKDYQSDENYQKAIADRDKAMEKIRESGIGPNELRSLLLAYWKRTNKSPYELRGGVFQLKKPVQDRIRQIRRQFGNN